MGLHIKSTTKFKVLIGTSAIAVSGVAALFSVTGVSSLFKGSWLTIVVMMGILEFAKIIVASYIARFWTEISKTLRAYFIAAVIILMAITSAGIFGYLSEAYQGTKGNYDITEQESNALSRKKSNYENQIANYTKRIDVLNSHQISQSVLDTLYIRKNFTSARAMEQRNKSNSDEIQSLNSKISAYMDSVSVIDNQIVTKQSVNIKGELGPLKFVADAFGTTMDSIVRYLILMLIFVFDPLAVLLFVSLSIMIRKEAIKEIVDVQTPEEELKEIVSHIKENSTEKKTEVVNPIILHVSDVDYRDRAITSSSTDIYTRVFEPSMTIVNLTSSLDQSVYLPESPQEPIEILQEITEIVPELTSSIHIISGSNEHEFYHATVESEKPIEVPQSTQQPEVQWRTANWKGRH